MPRVEGRQAGALREFEVFELKTGRDRASEQGVRAVNHFRGKPGPVWNHRLEAMALARIGAKKQIRPHTILRKDVHDRRTACVKMPQFVRSDPVQTRNIFPL